MLDNHLYNLVEQLSQESRSCWRLAKYIQDAGDCDPCRSFWQKLKADKEQHIGDLSVLIRDHIQDRGEETAGYGAMKTAAMVH